jgi:acetyl-CoA acetyltransferase
MPEAVIVATTRFAAQAGVPARRPPSPRATRARSTTAPPSLDIMSDEKAGPGPEPARPNRHHCRDRPLPAIMGLGPVEAVPLLPLRNAGMGLDAIDLSGINEALRCGRTARLRRLASHLTSSTSLGLRSRSGNPWA